MPNPESEQERELAEFTVRNDHGPWWPQVEVTARECLPRNGAEKPGEPSEFGLGPAHAEAWIWVEPATDYYDGGTYQFSLYWNDDLELAETQDPPEGEGGGFLPRSPGRPAGRDDQGVTDGGADVEHDTALAARGDESGVAQCRQVV